jgi:hypothetical protein
MAHFELDLDGVRLEALRREAARLGVQPDEVVRRAVAAWLVDMVDDGALQSVDPEQAEA